MIVAADLLDWQLEALVSVLKKFINAMGWTIVDIIGIPPSFCTHTIQLASNCKPSIENQMRLNPHMQEVFKKEIIVLKWVLST